MKLHPDDFEFLECGEKQMEYWVRQHEISLNISFNDGFPLAPGDNQCKHPTKKEIQEIHNKLLSSTYYKFIIIFNKEYN